MRRLLAAMLIFILASAAFGLSARRQPAHAQDQEPTQPVIDQPSRDITLTIDYTAYDWWLLRWRDSAVVCYFYVDHEGLPTADDISSYCGSTIGNQWKATKGCTLQEGQPVTSCTGLYLYSIGQHPARREVPVTLPLPSVWITLEGCEGGTPANRCSRLPTLVLTGEEPLPNESIVGIQGILNGVPFYCAGEVCRLPLQATGTQGVSLEFWAESTFGDASERYTAQVRVLPWGGFMDPDTRSSEPSLWYADIISSQWRGATVASCSAAWQSFPELRGPAPWLRTPERPEDLYSELELYLLGGVLIANGKVDASECPDGGLQPGEDRVASQCGVEAAYEELVAWQNAFDEEIFRVAQESDVPAQLLKNVFGRESQFWPGIYRTYAEAGLGQLTELGTDPILLWNPSFFDQFCPLVLHQATCDLGFGNLDADAQNMLRGALVSKVDASCPDCPNGIDLSRVGFSVSVFAEGLKANCEQVGRMIFNLTARPAGQIASYEDLWRFTLANYNAGSGCVSTAMRKVWNERLSMTWLNFADRLDPACLPVIDYVEDISISRSGIQPTPTSWVYQGKPPPQVTPGGLLPTFTPQITIAATATAGPTVTPGPSPTFFPTATQSDDGYPADETPVPTATVDYP